MNTKRMWWLLATAVLITLVPSAQAFYDPGTQRWITRDPIQEDGGFNLFEFVDNDPVDWIDSIGLSGASGTFPIVTPPTTTEPERDCAENCAKEFNDCMDRATAYSLGIGAGVGIGQAANKTAQKPRGGVAGGGKSGTYTSWTRKCNIPGGRAIGRTPVPVVALASLGISQAIGLTACSAAYSGCMSGCPSKTYECPWPGPPNLSKNSPPASCQL